MRANVGQTSLVEDEDAVAAQDRRNALGNDDLRRAGQSLAQTAADVLVRGHVDRAGRVVEDQNFRLLDDRAGNAQALALPAGEIRGVLLEQRLIAVRKTVDVFVGAGDCAGGLHLRQGRVGLAPAQVLGDRPGEERAVLQNHRHAVAQMLERVVPHVDAADAHRAAQRVVKARDQAHERGFALARAADHAYRLAALDMHCDMAQIPLLRVAGVAEADVVKVDAAVGHGLVRRAVGDVRPLVEDLVDAAHRRLRPRQRHDEP